MVEDLLTPTHLATVARVRSVCTVAGIGGALTSMAANMLASDGTAVGLAVGIVAPGAFILASEIASTASSLPKTTGTRPLMTTLVALLIIIGLSAAVVSFGHLREVVASVGEAPLAEILIAIVVDSVAVMGLIGHRLTGLYLHRHHAAVEVVRRAEREVAEQTRFEAKRQANAVAVSAQRRAERVAAKAARAEAADADGSPGGAPVLGDDPSLPPAERARSVAAANPSMTRAEIASVIGRGERTVRRYLAEGRSTPDRPVAGDDPSGAGQPGQAVEGSAGSNDENEPDEPDTSGREAPGLVAV